MKKYVAYRSKVAADILYQAYITDDQDNVYASSPWTPHPEEAEAWVISQGYSY
jgi:hypothetical protein